MCMMLVRSPESFCPLQQLIMFLSLSHHPPPPLHPLFPLPFHSTPHLDGASITNPTRSYAYKTVPLT